MAYQTELKGPRLVAKFCDTSIQEIDYDDSRWGRLQAKEAFFDLRQQGQDNDKVWAKYPHVVFIEVDLALPSKGTHSSSCEEFECPCKNKVAQTG